MNHEDFCHGIAIGCERCFRIAIIRWAGVIGAERCQDIMYDLFTPDESYVPRRPFNVLPGGA